MSKQEIQPNRSTTRNRRVPTAVKALAFAGIAVGGLGFAGHAQAVENHTPILDTDNFHTQLKDNPNLNNLLEMNGVSHEVKGLPQFRTVLSSSVAADVLASKLGDEISFTVPAGSNVNDQIHEQVKAKTGADLDGASTWEVVTEVGGSADNLVRPGDVKTYKVNQEAVSTIQDANVEVVVENVSPPVTETTQQVAASASEGSQTSTSAAEADAECNPTDVKGTFKATFTTDPNDEVHLSTNPALIHLEDVNPNDACSNNVLVEVFSSPLTSTTVAGFLESQTKVSEQIFKVGAERNEWLNFDTNACSGQIDVLRMTNDMSFEQIKQLPANKLNGLIMIDAATWENPDCLPTATPTNTATSTATFIATSTNTPEATNTPDVPTFTPTSTPTLEPNEFPDCETQIEEPGDRSHYENGTHWIVGNDGLLSGEDDVYTLENGNYLQCYCPDDEENVKGEEGIQTNWLNAHTETKPSEREGYFLVWGPDFGLDKSWFYASGADKPTPLTPNFDCNPEVPIETPTDTATASATPKPTDTPEPTNTNEPTQKPKHKKTATATNTPVTPSATPSEVPVVRPTETRGPSKPSQLPITGSGFNNSDSKGSNNSLMLAMAGMGAMLLAVEEATRRNFDKMKNNFSRFIAPAPIDLGPTLYEQRLLKLQYKSDAEEDDEDEKKESKS